MEHMIVANIALDILGILISLMLALYFIYDHKYRQKQNRYFLAVNLSNVFMILGDLGDWVFQHTPEPRQKMILTLLTVLFYFSSTLMLFFFSRYMDAYLQLSVRVRRIFFGIIAALCTPMAALSFLSPFTGAFFYITDHGYERGGLFLISQLVPLFCYLSFTAIVIMYRRQLTRREEFFFLLYIFIPLGAGILQFFMQGIAVVNICVVLSLLLIFINIQFEHELAMQRQEKALAELRIDIMLTQIQPHFLYNSLMAISHLCKQDPDEAQKAIRKFSLFLRENMDSLKNHRPIPFGQELKHVENYLYLEKYRFQDRLKVRYEVAVSDFFVPALSLQPLVENAVCHGVLHKEEGGTVIIRTEEDANAWLVIVEDDGIGMEQASRFSHTVERAHLGIENVRNRLRSMMNGSLELESSNAGTKAVMRIPKEGKK